MILSLLFSVLVSNPSFAIEAKNPVTMCDRFISAENQKSCEEKIKAISPDWYLASVCENLFEDSKFFECMEMSKVTSFNPKSLEKCGSAEFGDDQKMSCLKHLASRSNEDSARQPASVQKKKTNSKR